MKPSYDVIIDVLRHLQAKYQEKEERADTRWKERGNLADKLYANTYRDSRLAVERIMEEVWRDDQNG